MTGSRIARGAGEPRKRPRQARARATVDAIVEAASQVLCDRGFDETTTDRVAERAGVSVGTLYQYFPDKGSLVVALFERHLDEIEAAFVALATLLSSHPPPDEAIREMVRRLFALNRGAPEVHRTIFERAPASERLLERWTQLEARMIASLTRYFERHADDPGMSAYLAMSLIEMVAHRAALYGGPAPQGGETAPRSDEAIETATAAMILRSLR
jgi:AcrR family transcriptional regulator